MRCFAALTIWGSEVRFAASHSLLLMWESQASQSVSGLSPEETIRLQSMPHFFSFSLRRYTTVQELPQNVDLVCSIGNLLVSLVVTAPMSL